MIPLPKIKGGITAKFTLLICGVVLFATVSVGFMITYKFSNAILDQELTALEFGAECAGERYLSMINTLRNDISASAGLPPIDGIIRARRAGGIDPFDGSSETIWRRRLEKIFQEMLWAKPEYLQIRYIGVANEGRELVRVQREGSSIVVVPEDDLQSKGHRAYLRETLTLESGEIYLSDVTLNREHQQVVIPHQPVLRVATPIHDANGQIFGILIINQDLHYFIDRLSLIPDLERQLFITNEQGEYLLHPDEEKTFAFEFQSTSRLGDLCERCQEFIDHQGEKESIHLHVDEDEKLVAVGLHKVNFDVSQSDRFLTFIVTKDEAHIVAASTRSRHESLFMSAGLVGAALMLALLFSRGITTPLRRIAKAVEAYGQDEAEIFLPRDAQGEAGVLARSFSDLIEHVEDRTEQLLIEINERERIERKLQHDATHDVLTGLANRAALEAQLQRCLERIENDDAFQYAVMFLDFDRFKMVNDSLGHDIGDMLLVTFANRLRAVLASTEFDNDRDRSTTIARLGGDEFVILLVGLESLEAVEAVAARLHSAMNIPFNLDGHELFTSVSIGIAMSGAQYASVENLLRDADTALYRAKAEGRGCSRIFDQAMHETIAYQLKLENDLRRAINNDEFELHYQPIVSLETGTIRGFEALIRWRHAHRGLISPAEFIPFAEETNLIVPIGQWVLREACRQIRCWQDTLEPVSGSSISVNVAEAQLAEVDFMSDLKSLIDEYRIEPSWLRIEITESVIMRDPERMIMVMHEIKKLGVELHIDDFGTGYSSLSCLHEFPLDVIKVDRAFLGRLGAGIQFAAVLQAIVSLAHNLGMQVTAEGVETREQVAQVLALDCDFAQGYLFSRPVTAAEATSTLMKTNHWNLAA